MSVNGFTTEYKSLL